MSAVMDAIETGNAAFRRPEPARSAQRLFEPAGSTLEDTILGAWEDLAARGRAECPVCHAEIEPAGCAGCGSGLS